jgi:hypothetical protein
MRLYNLLLSSIYLICGAIATKDLIPYYNISFLDKRQSIGKVNDFSSINEETVPKVNKIFDLGSVSTIFKNDIQTPKLVGNVSVSEICGLDEEDVSNECLDILQSKYSCITLQNNDFNLFCKNLNETNCNLDNKVKFEIRDKCKVNLGDVEEFLKTINNIISTKQFFCIKMKNETDYCPLTLSLQKGYLDLVKLTEKNEKEIAKKKRSPLISNVNTYIPSRSIDLQVIRRNLVKELKENCKDDVCHKKAIEYINNIRQDYSYFNLIYQYQINDDTLRDSLLKVLREGECSRASMKYIFSCQLLLSIILLAVVILF